jgi:hypothetical protein
MPLKNPKTAEHQRIASDPVALALAALTWLVADSDRSTRLLSLTGLSPAELRSRAAEPDLLAAVIAFLEANEADLIACAEALEVDPAVLVRAREQLEA